MTDPNDANNRLEQATRSRLAKLAGVPVDTSGLERRLKEGLDKATEKQQNHRFRSWRWPTISGVAAAVVFTALVGIIFLSTKGSAVIAAPAELARVHGEVLEGDHVIVRTSDFITASDAIRTRWSQAPDLPQPSAGKVISCCIHDVQRRKVACVLLEYKGQPVTMVVGYSRDLVCSTEHPTVVGDGRTYFIHAEGELQMVMIQHTDRWVCLMSELSIEDLVELADGLAF